jgi:hypothetical protein
MTADKRPNLLKRLAAELDESELYAETAPRIATPEQLAREAEARNLQRSRRDLIWIVDGQDVRLVEDPEHAQRRIERLAEEREAERIEENRRRGLKLSPPAPHWQDDSDDD